ncbi:MAG: dethiobiotin synthase [Chthoniobacteraceae bacterium]
MHVFITGTDTEVGKTYVSCLLIRALRQAGIDAVGIKPISCGDRADAEALYAASDGVATLNEINPVWLRTPAAPYTAAMIEERPIDLALIREGFDRLKAAHEMVVMEGVGGWRVPIAQDYYVSDLAREFSLPVLVVAANKLGALNHTILTVEAVRQSGRECLGVVWNDAVADVASPAAATNKAVFDSLVQAGISLGVNHDQAALTQADIATLLSVFRQQ